MTTSNRALRVVGIATVVAAVAALAACGVPTGDDTFEEIEDADVPLNLAQPSTTTSTTTTTTTTTLVPPTTVPMPSTTAGTQPETAPVSLYFVLGDEALPVIQETISQYTPTSLIDLLATGPDETTSPGLTTLVDEDLVNDVTVRAGLATVDIDQSELRLVPDRDRALLFGQIVLTITDNGTRAGTVAFTFDGVIGEAALPNNLFKRNVTFDDYVDLIANAIVVPETTTTTSTTSLPPPSTSTTSTTSTTAPSTTTG